MQPRFDNKLQGQNRTGSDKGCLTPSRIGVIPESWAKLSLPMVGQVASALGKGES